jgi:hypothetical protein
MSHLPSVVTLLTILRISVLVVGAVVLAVWASRLPDQHSSIVERLSSRRSKGNKPSA